MKKSISIFLVLITSNYYLCQCISGDCVNGHGKYITSWMDKYVGEWRNGERSGYGTYTWHIGDKYQGKWSNNVRNGYGTLTYSNGDKLKGYWRDDKYKIK